MPQASQLPLLNWGSALDAPSGSCQRLGEKKQKIRPAAAASGPRKKYESIYAGVIKLLIFLGWNQIEILQMYGKLWVISLIIVHGFRVGLM